MTLLVTVGWLAQYDLTIADCVCMAAGVLYFNALNSCVVYGSGGLLKRVIDLQHERRHQSARI